MLKNKIGLSAGLLGLGIAASNLIGSIFAFADDSATAAPASATADPNQQLSWFQKIPAWVLIIVYVVILGAMFFFLIIRPQRKRKKEEEEMKNSITLGQEVVTIGGIVGTIVNIKDDNITLQTSIDNSLVEVKNWAIREYKKEVKAEEKDK
ncbi:MAG: preprotein translocase subunit YajC [Clostridia bacterium]|nr:preprotein translocase subunit YajC [Clostridia bacterium]